MTVKIPTVQTLHVFSVGIIPFVQTMHAFLIGKFLSYRRCMLF